MQTNPSSQSRRTGPAATLLAIALAATWLMTPRDATADLRWSACQPPGQADQADRAIGRARMLEDGTILLDQLRFEGTNGTVGHSPPMLYRRDHPEYAALLRHIGGLRPNEVKPLPWCQ